MSYEKGDVMTETFIKQLYLVADVNHLAHHHLIIAQTAREAALECFAEDTSLTDVIELMIPKHHDVDSFYSTKDKRTLIVYSVGQIDEEKFHMFGVGRAGDGVFVRVDSPQFNPQNF